MRSCGRAPTFKVVALSERRVLEQMASVLHRPRVALVGLGGVGGVLAAALETAGACDLTVFTRGAALATLRSPEGLHTTLCDGTAVRCRPFALEACPSAVPPPAGAALHESRGVTPSSGGGVGGRAPPPLPPPPRPSDDGATAFDFVVLCTKAQQLPSTLPLLRRLIGARTAVVPVVNGLP